MSKSTNITVAAAQHSFQQALSQHRPWIEAKLRVPWCQTVCLATDLPFSQVATRRVLGCRFQDDAARQISNKLLPRIMTVKVPPYEQVWLSSQGDEFDYFEGAPTYRKRSRQALQWLDCPALIRIRGMQTAFVAMRVPFIETLESHCETWQNLIIAPRHGMHEVMELIAELTVRTDAPQLCVLHGGRSNISSCPWSDLVLDETVTRLLKDDFTSFYQREEWFRRNRLPFRRGYLLHGAPGNGKTSVIRAMMWSQRLDAYTLRLFQPTTDDSDLERLFATAHANRPCMVVLEDLDRAFPKSEESRCRVSLQALLNTLDGLVSTDAIVTVATANHPARLDPAVLQRPAASTGWSCSTTRMLRYGFDTFKR